jgi:thioesterase domain-containing protein
MGEIFYCRNLSRSLGVDQPLFGLRSQGLGGEEPNHTVEDMASHYLQEIRTIQPKGPYFLSGFCFGGMVAYEMARLLKIQGEEVALVVLFNTVSITAMVRHYREEKERIYGLDIEHLDAMRANNRDALDLPTVDELTKETR